MKRTAFFLFILSVALMSGIFLQGARSGPSAQSTPVSGAEVYKNNCAACHDQTNLRIPPHDSLKRLSAARILRTLDFGVMMGVAYPLRRPEREAVANYLGMPGDDPPPSEGSFCADRTVHLSGETAGDWNGWSPATSNARFQTASDAGLTIEQVRNLKLKWAFGFPGDITAFAAPTVLDGNIFVGSASGMIRALDAKTGCLRWFFQASGPVRSAVLAVRNSNATSLLFGDQIGWFYSLDAQSGRLLWKKKIDTHDATRLTGSPAAHDGVVFVPAASWEETRSGNPKYPCCTFRGSVTALHVGDGSLIWKSYMTDAPAKRGPGVAGIGSYGPSGAGVWSAPTLDVKRGLLYVTTGDNYSSPATNTSDAVVALQLKTGKIAWSQQMTPNDVYSGACENAAHCGPDFDFGSSAVLVNADGRDVLFAGQKSAIVYALDPDQKGRVVWQTQVGKGGENGGIEWGMASDGQKLYAAVNDGVRLPESDDADGSPLGHASFDPAQGGGLTALLPANGAKAWFAPGHPCFPPRRGCSPAQSGAVTAIPGAVFSGSLDGHIRAFAAQDGKLLWDFDTVKDYTTVNSIHAKGGSLDGAGPVVSNGMVFVNSGYPRFGGVPGNVLLAFAADDAPK